jgi:hypothetical protein
MGEKEKDGGGVKYKDLFICPWWPWLEKKETTNKRAL